MLDPVIAYDAPRNCPRCGCKLWPETLSGHYSQVHPRLRNDEPRVGGQREEAELHRWQDRQRYAGPARTPDSERAADK